MLARAALRTSAMISPMAKAGLRPEVMGNHGGTDGLRMRGLPDVVIHRGVARRMRAPCQIMVRGELSKAGHQYFTFLTASGTNKLLAYLNDRLARGRPLHGDSAVIAPDHTRPLNRGRNSLKAFLPTVQISKEIRSAFRPRFPWRPYIMRAYYDTELLIAEARGKMAHDFRVFFMGHKGPVEARHAANKGMLPEAPVREMRDAFARSEPLPGLEAQATAPEADRRQEMHELVQGAAADELGPMLEALRRAGKGGPARPSQTLTVPSG